ncbi:hypothetical protein TB1_038063 [Malus domestica]
MRDFERLQQDLPARISGAPQDNNIMLSARIYGCNAFDACNQEDATTLMELLWHVTPKTVVPAATRGLIF